MDIMLSLLKAVGTMAGILGITALMLWGSYHHGTYTLIAVIVALTGLMWWVFYYAN